MDSTMNDASNAPQDDGTGELGYQKPALEQELRADLEEVWQGESPSTARRTDFADEVDGRLGTRERSHPVD